MKRIIGSERVFSSEFLTPNKNRFIEKLDLGGGIELLSSGRSAIRALLTDVYRPDRLLIPDFDCAEVENAVRRSGVKFSRYRVNSAFKSDISFLEKALKDSKYDAIYIVDYYGMRDQALISFAERKGIRVIIDRTHSLFNNHPRSSDYEIGSFRKLFPVPDGGFITSTKKFEILFRKDLPDFPSMKLNSKVKKSIYNDLLPSPAVESEYLYDSETAEKLIDDSPFRISSFSSTIISRYDIKSAVLSRKENRDTLVSSLNRLLPASSSKQILQSFPIFIPERDSAKSILQGEKIFLPVLWRGKADFQLKLLNIPLDEEYSKKDMLKISKSLNRIFYDTVA